jgi:hypothetical protein
MVMELLPSRNCVHVAGGSPLINPPLHVVLLLSTVSSTSEDGPHNYLLDDDLIRVPRICIAEDHVALLAQGESHLARPEFLACICEEQR